MIFFKSVIGNIKTTSTGLYDLHYQWCQMYDASQNYLFYTLENLYYQNGTSIQATQDALMPSYTLMNSYKDLINAMYNYTNNSTHTFYQSVWNDSDPKTDIIYQLFNITYKNNYYEFNKDILTKNFTHDLTLSDSSFTWIAEANSLNALIAATTDFA